jgi:hypothetical protein
MKVGGVDIFIFTGASSPDQASTPSASASASTPDTPSDRNSIGFLLNLPGEMDFMREFPKSTTMSPSNHSTEVSNITPSGSAYEHTGGESSSSSHGGPAGPMYQDYGHMAQENNLDDLLRRLEFQTTYERETNSWQMQENIMPWPGSDQFLDIQALEQRAYDIREKLKYTAVTQNTPHLPSRELLEAIELVTAHNIARFIRLYFKHWHKHAPMIHEPTFNPVTAALPLVLALFSLGGMVRIFSVLKFGC